MAEYLSAHFTLEEMTVSETAKAKGISNNPTPIHKKVLQHTCQYLLEKVRALLNEKYKVYKGKPVQKVTLKVTSGYRSAALNKAVGGATTSQHCKGEAADCEATIVFQDGKREVLPFNVLYEDIKVWVKTGRMSVDQCIQEQSGTAKWVHISHSAAGATKDRRQFLKYNKGVYSSDCTFR